MIKMKNSRYVYKGTVKNRPELIGIDHLTLLPGDVYLNLENNILYAWNGSKWTVPKKNK